MTPCRHLEARGTGSPARGRVGYGGVAAAICAPTTSPLPPRCLPPTPHPGSDESRTQNNTRAAPAVARPSSNLSLLLPTSLLGEVVPCQSLPPPSPPSLPVSWPDSPLSGAGARNPRLGSLIDLTADRAATDQSPILALTPPRAD